jgi:hypothetical protein
MVNDALSARGRDESLYPGEGYFFFGGGDAVHWLSSSVMVKKISDLTLEQWLAKFDELLEREGKLQKQEGNQKKVLGSRLRPRDLGVFLRRSNEHT